MSTAAASRSQLFLAWLLLAALLAAPASALAETTDWSPWGWQKGQIQQWVDDDGWTQPPGGQYGCLAVQGGSAEIGTPIVGGTCGADDPATNFVLTRTGELRIDPRIRGDGCVDVMGGDSSEGTPLWVWWCNGTAAQRWSFSLGTIRVEHATPGREGVIQKCLTRPNEDAYSDPYISLCGFFEWLDPYVFHRNQLWSYDPDGGLIHPYGNPYGCLTVYDQVARDQSRITVRPCAYYGPQGFITLQHQQWIAGAGGFQSALDPGKCLDVQWGNWDDGTPLHLWSCNGTDAQSWLLEGELTPAVGDGKMCIRSSTGSQATIRTCSLRAYVDTFRLWMPEEVAQ